MSDFTINVCYDPSANPKFQYTDEGGASASTKQHCLGGKKIKWVIKQGCSGVTDLKIHFLDGSAFDPNTTDPAPDVNHKFSAAHHHKSSYKYNVLLKYNGQQKEDDPTIMFDDGSDLSQDVGLFDDALEKVGTKAQAAFQALLKDVGDAKSLDRNPNGEFFPGGITNISVQVTVATVTVSLTVSGPDATALFPPGPKE